MRRGPQEEDDGEEDRLGGETGVDRRRTREHGEGAGEAAHHDVEPGSRFEPNGVDEGVGERACERIERWPEGGGEQGEPHAEKREQNYRDVPPRARAPTAGHKRTRGGAPHACIELAFPELVEGPGSCRGEEDANGERPDALGTRQRSRRDRHAAERRHSDQNSDPQLEHCDEISREPRDCSRLSRQHGTCPCLQSRSVKWPQFRQIPPVNEIVEYEGYEENGNEYVGSG